MKEYHKIQTVFLRDPQTNFKTLLNGQFAMPEFEYLAINIWVFTEKVDGTNIRVMFDGEEINFGGKTDNSEIPAFLINRLNETFLPKLKYFRDIFTGPTCLYGEGYGAKIQKVGGKYRADQDFVLFDIKCGDWWLQRKDVEDIVRKLELDIVPIIYKGTLFEMVEMARSGFDSTWGSFMAEGIVARPETELMTRGGHRIITKIKHKDFPALSH